MRRRWKGWELSGAALAGALAAVSLPYAFYGGAVSEIVTILGFLMAALVPAMALAATSIRAGGFSVKHIRALGTAVQTQIQVFGGLLLYSLVACVIMIAGKLVDWSLPSLVINFVSSKDLNLSFLFPAVLTFVFAFLFLRSGTFVSGVLSILRLTTTMAEDEALSRDRTKDLAAVSDLDEYEMPVDYGTTLHN